MRAKIKWTTNKINKVRRAIRNGMSQREVANLMKMSQPTISRIFKQIQDQGSIMKPVKVEAIVPPSPTQNSVVTQPTKRRRGRPAKQGQSENHEVMNMLSKMSKDNAHLTSVRKRGRPKKVSVPTVSAILDKTEQPADAVMSIQQYIDQLNKPLDLSGGAKKKSQEKSTDISERLEAANSLLQEISNMSWFQRKDCHKLIKGYFDNYGV